MEHEMNRLKAKISKLLGEKVNTTYLTENTNRNKYSTVPAWVEMTSLICNPEGKSRGKWKTETSDYRKEEELSKRIIQEHQEMQEKVINENSELRESYYNFQYGLVKVLREQEGSNSLQHYDQSLMENDSLDELDCSVLLPLDISREQLIDTSDKVIQNVSNILQRHQDKIVCLGDLLKDYKSISDTSNMVETEDAIKFILKHKEILQQQEENNHLQKTLLERRETELKIAETEFQIYKEKSFIDDINLNTPMPLSNVSHISGTCHEGPSWSLGRVNSTLPPTGKQTISNVPWPGVKIGSFPTDVLQSNQSKRSSMGSKPRSLSHENELKRGSLSPQRMLSPGPLADAKVTFRRSSNTTKLNKPRPRSTNLSPSPTRIMFPRGIDSPSKYKQNEDRAKLVRNPKIGNSGSLSDSCNSSLEKHSRSLSRSPTSFQR